MGVDSVGRKILRGVLKEIMAEIKLTYFNVKARAEVTRLILAYAGVKYVNERFTKEEFDPKKSSFRYGQLPVLTYNGEEMYQSLAIARFLAAEFNLAGKNNIEAAQADEVVDAVLDIMVPRWKILFGPESEREEGLAKYFDETATPCLERLEKLLHARGGQFLVGNKLTWADIYVFSYYDGTGDKEFLNNFPGLKNLMGRIEGLPNIKNYLSNRPETLMPL